MKFSIVVFHLISASHAIQRGLSKVAFYLLLRSTTFKIKCAIYFFFPVKGMNGNAILVRLAAAMNKEM